MNPKILAIGALAAIMVSCHDKAATADPPQFAVSDSLLRTIKTEDVIECPLVKSLTLTGKVSYNEQSVDKVFPLVSGNINDIKVQLGDYVHQGQTLGVINSMEMAGYANDLAAAKANEVSAKRQLDASEEMIKSGLISQRDFVAAKSAYEQAEAQVTKTERVLRINGGNMQSQFAIKAPVSGFVIDKQATNNMSIRTDNANPLFIISDLKNVWIWANVYESNIADVHLGDEVDVTTLAYPDKKFAGTIDKVLNVLDPTNKVMKIRVVLPNPDYLLKPEMFASITVANKTDEQSLCVPSASLVFDNSQYYVLTYKDQTDIKITPVQVTSKYGEKTFITGDIHQGDKVVSSNTVLIYQALNG
jgi:membrane fusion protein, heavy metal efflux system